MPIGDSGRIVIEIDPELKKELYRALSKKGLNLKQWFLGNTHQFLDEKVQLSLPLFGIGSIKGGNNEI